MLIILIILFILLIVILALVKFTFKFEGFNDFSHIDRIQTSDQKFGYCIGGSVSCTTGAPILIGNYNGGNTYKSSCDDGSNMVCNNTLATNFDVVLNSNGDYIWRTAHNSEIDFSSTYKGFTTSISYIPAILNDDKLVFYDSNNTVLDTIDKCSILNVVDQQSCYKSTGTLPNKSKNLITTYYDQSSNDLNSLGYNSDPKKIGQFIPSYTEPQSESAGNYSNLPCIADYSPLSGGNHDYSAMPGDNICNGEFGLLQDKSLVCPYYKPICKGYSCGSNFGTCDYSK
jgi:hypothetical protein